MWQGEVVAIFITPKSGQNMQSLPEVKAIVGNGLQGDRYFLQEGTFSNKKSSKREVTLIESEALEALQRDYRISLPPDQSRRNILTRKIPLNHLVDVEFSVGEAVLKGVELCEPCSYLEKITQSGVRKGLLHRGGLRAQIISGGNIRVKDTIVLK